MKTLKRRKEKKNWFGKEESCESSEVQRSSLPWAPALVPQSGRVQGRSQVYPTLSTRSRKLAAAEHSEPVSLDPLKRCGDNEGTDNGSDNLESLSQ